MGSDRHTKSSNSITSFHHEVGFPIIISCDIGTDLGTLGGDQPKTTARAFTLNFEAQAGHRGPGVRGSTTGRLIQKHSPARVYYEVCTCIQLGTCDQCKARRSADRTPVEPSVLSGRTSRTRLCPIYKRVQMHSQIKSSPYAKRWASVSCPAEDTVKADGRRTRLESLGHFHAYPNLSFPKLPFNPG